MPKLERPNLIIHSGDFFDTPSGTEQSPPPEYSRKVTAETFMKLNKEKIPIVIVDGNHGRYMQYQISPLSEYSIIFDNVHIFTHFDIKDAIRNNKPLFKDFNEFNLRIHAHPSIESHDMPQLYSKYEEWVYTQNKNINSDMINVSIVHGMIENKTLHKDVINGGRYDYIAMGDNHKMQEISYNAWYSGSPQLWSFSEYENRKGYINVEIENNHEGNNKCVKILPKTIPLKRKIISEKIKLFYDDTNSSVINRVLAMFNKNNLHCAYDYPTSARVRLIFHGDKIIGTLFNIHEIITYLNQIALDDDNYNISEFLMDFSYFTCEPFKTANNELNMSLYGENGDSEKFIDYLIENPETEFKEYICSNREEDLKKNNIDPNYLANIFSTFLQKHSNELLYKKHDNNYYDVSKKNALIKQENQYEDTTN